MAEAEHRPGSYAEQLLEEFQTLIKELDSVIADARAAKDMKTYFDAVSSKTDVLKAKSRAFGVSAPTGARRVGGRAGKAGDDPGRVERGDVGKVIESFQRTTQNEDEVAGVGGEAQSGESG